MPSVTDKICKSFEISLSGIQQLIGWEFKASTVVLIGKE